VAGSSRGAPWRGVKLGGWCSGRVFVATRVIPLPRRRGGGGATGPNRGRTPPIRPDLASNERSPRVSFREEKNTRWTLRIQLPRAGDRGAREASLGSRTSTSQNRELMSSSLAPPRLLVVRPAVDRGPLLSEVLRRFGIGIAGEAPSWSEFSRFIAGEAALVSNACASGSSCVAITRVRVRSGPFVHSDGGEPRP
jgi:hypothetical protein